MEIIIPHFDLPFRFQRQGASGQVAMVEQDSMSDIANCVEMIAKTPLNWRDEAPGFGLPDLTFMKLPIRPETVEQSIAEQEPRIGILVREEPGLMDELVDKIIVELHARGGRPE